MKSIDEDEFDKGVALDEPTSKFFFWFNVISILAPLVLLVLTVLIIQYAKNFK